MTTAKRADLALALAVVSLKLALSFALVRAGFSHISDDDFSRIVIAEKFAHGPALDPSHTSWLPFPFWTTGTAMMLFGRSIGVARMCAMLLSAVTLGGLFAHARRAGLSRYVALGLVVLVGLTPWDVFAGATAVPESFCAHAVGFAMVDLCAKRVTKVAAGLLLAATLSRYEAWPLAAVYTIWFTYGGLRLHRAGTRATTSTWIAVVLPALGPVLWIAWNMHAHGSPLHFLDRVASYRQRLLPGAQPLSETLLFYPKALIAGFPESIGLAAVCIFLGTLMRSARSQIGGADKPSAQVKGGIVGTVAIAVYLVIGALRGGAPTHHEGRALLPLFVAWATTTAFACDRLVPAWWYRRAGRKAWAVAALTFSSVVWLGAIVPLIRAWPGASTSEARATQIAEGVRFARELPVTATLEVRPCAYEHLALIAAFGAPERVTILPQLTTHASCPLVEIHR